MENRWLEHSGRLGMKWGERNGPPYPLYRQKRFSSSGAKKLSDEDYLRVTANNYVHYKNSKKTEPVKDGKRWMFNKVNADFSKRPDTGAIKQRSVKDLKDIKDIQRYDNKFRNALNENNLISDAKILGFNLSRLMDETKNGFPMQRKKTTIEEDLKLINPSYRTETYSGNSNCLLCTVAFDMRQRGYDVIARQRAPIEYLWDINTPDFTYLYKGSKVTKARSAKDMERKLSKEKNSRGALLATWNGVDYGHCVAYDVKNGKVTAYDAQDGSTYDDISELFDVAHEFRSVRLDNIEPNYSLVQLAVE